jgi:short-subunit dehydrogenase
MMKELRNRTVLLTGAPGGIGPHIASRLHAEGASLVLSGRDRAELDELAAELSPARVEVADLSRQVEVERLATAAGQVDVLVANAGIPASGRLVSFSVEEIDRTLNVNLRSAMVLARLLVPGMVSRGTGHIVLIASIHGKLPAALVSVYNATKFGLRGFGLALGQELRGTGVGVSVINPTFVREAGMWAETGVTPHPLAGLVTPDQVAAAVIKAIKENRTEIDVAPLSARLAVTAPRLVGSLAGRLGATAFPPEGVEPQLAKR